MSSSPVYIACVLPPSGTGWGYDVQKIPYLSRTPATWNVRKYTSGTPREQNIYIYGNTWLLTKLEEQNGTFVATGGFLADLITAPIFRDGFNNTITTGSATQDATVHIVDQVLSAFALDPSSFSLELVTEVTINPNATPKVSWTTGTVSFAPFNDYDGGLVPATIGPLPDVEAIVPPGVNSQVIIAGHNGRFNYGGIIGAGGLGCFIPNSNQKTKNTPYSGRQGYTEYNLPIFQSTKSVASMWWLRSETSTLRTYTTAQKADWEAYLNDPSQLLYPATYSRTGYASFEWS